MSQDTLVDELDIEPECDGRIGVRIPSHLLWDCVECFGENRLSAHFTFSAPRFVAHISGTSSHRVRETLKNWKAVQARASALRLAN
jgi:hypothetical protein